MQTSQRLLFATAVVTGIALAAAPRVLRAQQNFPMKPIRLVSSTTAGGQPDSIARMIAQKMSEHWGRPRNATKSCAPKSKRYPSWSKTPA